MGRKKKGDPVSGWLVLDKPEGLNSTKAVSIVRRLFNAAKAGHAGTLDPLATGILPIALGEATKTVSQVMDGVKIYEFTVTWGAETSTDDSEGEITATSLKRCDEEEITALLPEFEGKILQVPPQYSAIKVDGARAYDLARSGEDVKLKPREVEVYELSVTEFAGDDQTSFLAVCSKGTYVRSIARDLGRELGCLGHISALRRLQSGPFTEDLSISLEKLQELSHSAPARDAIFKFLRPIETALDDIPALAVNERDAAQLRLGQSITLRGRDAPIIKGQAYAMSGKKIVALGVILEGAFKPARIFNLDDAGLNQ